MTVAAVPVRLRLIPTRGRPRSWFAWDVAEAREQAQAYAVEEDVPVLVCRAPEGGTVSRLFVASPPEKPKQKGPKR